MGGLEDFLKKKNPGPNFAPQKYLGQGKFYLHIVLYTNKKTGPCRE